MFKDHVQILNAYYGNDWPTIRRSPFYDHMEGALAPNPNSDMGTIKNFKCAATNEESNFNGIIMLIMDIFKWKSKKKSNLLLAVIGSTGDTQPYVNIYFELSKHFNCKLLCHKDAKIPADIKRIDFDNDTD